jgi:hypothetical protein
MAKNNCAACARIDELTEMTRTQFIVACVGEIELDVVECAAGVGEARLNARYFSCVNGHVLFYDPTFCDHYVRVDHLAYDKTLGL